MTSDKGWDDTYIVATEDTNDFAVAVQLAEDPLLHVLGRDCQRGSSTEAVMGMYDTPSSIPAELEASWAS